MKILKIVVILLLANTVILSAQQVNQVDDKKETDGFLAFLPESLMSIFEQVNVDRMEDDSFDEDALYHAEDLDEITIGKKQANLSARVKLDLDLAPDMTEIYPLGKGHLIDEWDYRKDEYLINYHQKTAFKI